MKNAFFLLPALLFVACCDLSKKEIPAKPLNTYTSPEDTLYLPFDTTKVFEMMDITLQLNKVKELGNEQVEGLSEDWDTLELTYHMFACDCPNWMIQEEYAKQEFPDLYHPQGYAFYIQPADKSLKLDERLYFQSTVRFIGKRYKEPQLPDEYIDPGPPAGNKFRYYAYEILKPSIFMGPLYHTGKTEIPSDTVEMIERTHLILE